MRQLGCMSADVYCQKLNNHSDAELSYLYLNRKKEKQARRKRDRERVCERWRVAENRVGIHCKNSCWGATKYFRIS
jgi:hypothetical protein